MMLNFRLFFKLFEIYLLLQTYYYFTASIEIPDDCNKALGMENGDIPDSWISASSSHDIESLGPQYARLHNERSGGAWCPLIDVKTVSSDTRVTDEHFLEINLQSLYIIKAVETQGRYSGGDGQEFMEKFKLAYARSSTVEGKSQTHENLVWKTYRDPNGSTIFNGNNDTKTAVKKVLTYPIIANKIRFIPYDVPLVVCMRVEIYGCMYRDGITSYTAPRGNLFPLVLPNFKTYGGIEKIDLTDKSYDNDGDLFNPPYRQFSDQILYPETYNYDEPSLNLPSELGGGHDNILKNGLGQLTNGIKGADDFIIPTSTGIDWVGWKRSDSLRKVDLTFYFDTVRKFEAVSIYVNNNFNYGVRVFKEAHVSFSLTNENLEILTIPFEENEITGLGQQQAGKLIKKLPPLKTESDVVGVISYRPVADYLMTFSRTIRIPLRGNVGKEVIISLLFDTDWILVSEITFESTTTIPATLLLPPHPLKSITQKGNLPPVMESFSTASPNDIKVMTNSQKIVSGNQNMIVLIAALMISLFIMTALVWVSRKYYLRSKFIEKKVLYSLTMNYPYFKKQQNPSLNLQGGLGGFVFHRKMVKPNSEGDNFNVPRGHDCKNSAKTINNIQPTYIDGINGATCKTSLKGKSYHYHHTSGTENSGSESISRNEALLMKQHPTLKKILCPDTTVIHSQTNGRNEGSSNCFFNQNFVPSPYLGGGGCTGTGTGGVHKSHYPATAEIEQYCLLINPTQSVQPACSGRTTNIISHNQSSEGLPMSWSARKSKRNFTRTNSTATTGRRQLTATTISVNNHRLGDPSSQTDPPNVNHSTATLEMEKQPFLYRPQPAFGGGGTGTIDSSSGSSEGTRSTTCGDDTIGGKIKINSNFVSSSTNSTIASSSNASSSSSSKRFMITSNKTSFSSREICAPDANPYASVDMLQRSNNNFTYRGICGNNLLLFTPPNSNITDPKYVTCGFDGYPPFTKNQDLQISCDICDFTLNGGGKLAIGTFKGKQENIVIKTHLTPINHTDAAAKELFEKELIGLSNLSHTNVCRLLSIIVDEYPEDDTHPFNPKQAVRVGLVQEYGLCDLYEFLRSQPLSNHPNNKLLVKHHRENVNPSSTSNLLHFAQQISCGMSYLESRGIIHGDLAARNCVLTQNFSIKISDTAMASSCDKYDLHYFKCRPFNNHTMGNLVNIDENAYTKYQNPSLLMNIIPESISSYPLPIRWMSSEVLFQSQFSSKSDVYAYGITLWEILTHAFSPLPFNEFTNEQYVTITHDYYCQNTQISDINQNALHSCASYLPYSLSLGQLYQQTPNFTSDDMNGLILSCLNCLPANRPNFDTINKFFLNRMR